MPVTDDQEPELCVRWGEGKGRCIRHWDHVGECRDAAGNTTTSIRDELLGRARRPLYEE